MDSHSSAYGKLLIFGDFSIEVYDQNMKNFCDSYNLTSLINQSTCYKNPSHLKFIDLIPTNVPRSFQTTCVIETGLSDFHLMTLTVMRKSFINKMKPRVINYRPHKYFSNEVFKESLLEKLSQQAFGNNDHGSERFYKTTLKTLDKYAPRKAIHARGNQVHIITKVLSKNIMKRLRVRNKYLKNRAEENRKTILC